MPSSEQVRVMYCTNLWGWTHQASETAKFVRTASTSRQELFREEHYKLDPSGEPILQPIQETLSSHVFFLFLESAVINLQTHRLSLALFAALFPKLWWQVRFPSVFLATREYLDLRFVKVKHVAVLHGSGRDCETGLFIFYLVVIFHFSWPLPI